MKIFSLLNIFVILFFYSCSIGKEKKISFYYKNGNLKKEVYLKNNKPNGFTKIYNQSGVLVKEFFYKDGILSGLQKEYYDNGDIKLLSNYVNGLKEGEFVLYYLNAIIKAKGFYNKGFKNGKWIYYFENLEEEKTGYYNNGKKIGEWNYLKKKEVIDFIVIDDTVNNLSFSLPKSWIVNNNLNEVLYYGKKNDECGILSFNLSIEDSFKSNYSLVSNIQSYLFNMKKELPNIDFYNDTIINLSDKKNKYLLKYSTSDNVIGYECFENFDGILYIFSFYASKSCFYEEEFVFNEILESFYVD